LSTISNAIDHYRTQAGAAAVSTELASQFRRSEDASKRVAEALTYRDKQRAADKLREDYLQAQVHRLQSQMTASRNQAGGAPTSIGSAAHTDDMEVDSLASDHPHNGTGAHELHSEPPTADSTIQPPPQQYVAGSNADGQHEARDAAVVPLPPSDGEDGEIIDEAR
jgi:hypothetical protein